jgi:hypothetical protein
VESARSSLRTIIGFLCRCDILDFPVKVHEPAVLIHEEALRMEHSPCGGMFIRHCTIGSMPQEGEMFAEILNLFTGFSRTKPSSSRSTTWPSA